MSTEFDQPVQELAVLADPVPQSIYQVPAAQATPASREHVAEAMGTSVMLVAFHLEELPERGLLQADYSHPARGPSKATRPRSRAVAARGWPSRSRAPLRPHGPDPRPSRSSRR